MPVIAGRKSKLESFAGANITYTIEAMMGDKKALQVHMWCWWAVVCCAYGSGCWRPRGTTTDTLAGCVARECVWSECPLFVLLSCALLLQSGTSHNLGDNFARAFNTQFVDEQQQMR
jgi:prolyl-tRNA synthetase